MANENGPSASTSSPKKAPVETEGRWSRWGKAGFQKSIKVSDWISPYANKVSAAVGGERFWPQSNDMPLEIEKCERILRAFTVEGVQQKETKEEKVQDEKGNWIHKKVKVLRKIPPAAIRNAKGIAIYSSMRSGIAPLGGGGGSGLFLARLPDGSWSAPTAISPQSGAVGLLLGVDFLDVVLLINSEKTLETFKAFRVDLGAETGLTAGPYGSGYSAEASYDRAPVYSYVRNRGAYAGVELLGQLFLQRFDENERFYFWPGVSAREILEGKVRIPPSVYPLHRALRDAETGRAQGGKLERTEFDIIKIPESEVFKQLGPNGKDSPRKKRFVAKDSTAPISGMSTPRSANPNGEEGSSALSTPKVDTDSLQELNLEEAALEAEKKLEKENGMEEEGEEEYEESVEIVQDGERLRLPPTPAELEMMEAAGIPDEEDIRIEKEDRIRIYQLPAPPLHPDVRRYWSERPELSGKRPTEQLVMDGPNGAEVRMAQFVPLPPSPKEEARDIDALHDQTFGRYILDGQPITGEDPDMQGEVLASGIGEDEVERVMEAAVNGDVEEAKRIGKEAEAEKESHKEEDIAGNTDEANQRGSLEVQENPSISSHTQSFESTAGVTGEESKETSSIENAADNIDGNATTDTVVNSSSSDQIKGEESEIPQIKADTVPSRPVTPTNILQSTDSDVASGVETPIASDDGSAQKAGPKSTPSRPPRRKRPSKKNL